VRVSTQIDLDRDPVIVVGRSIEVGSKCPLEWSGGKQVELDNCTAQCFGGILELKNPSDMLSSSCIDFNTHDNPLDFPIQPEVDDLGVTGPNGDTRGSAVPLHDHSTIVVRSG
jgi:hypothetical protein